MPVRPALLALALVLGAAVAPHPVAAESPSKSYLFGERNFRDTCRPPLKYAAGACVAECPGGYEDNGSYCRQRNDWR